MDMGDDLSSDSEVSMQGSSIFPFRPPLLQCMLTKIPSAGHISSKPGKDNPEILSPSLRSLFSGLIGVRGILYDDELYRVPSCKRTHQKQQLLSSDPVPQEELADEQEQSEEETSTSFLPDKTIMPLSDSGVQSRLARGFITTCPANLCVTAAKHCDSPNLGPSPTAKQHAGHTLSVCL